MKSLGKSSQNSLVTSSAEQKSQTAQSTASPRLEEIAKTFAVTVSGGKIAGESAFSVLQGEAVVLKITSDAPGDFKINGLEKSVSLQSGTAAELKFTPNLVGRFPFVFGSSIVEIGVIEVFPK